MDDLRDKNAGIYTCLLERLQQVDLWNLSFLCEIDGMHQCNSSLTPRFRTVPLLKCKDGIPSFVLRRKLPMKTAVGTGDCM
uniref:Uncharacterized protein n=1 Tax=Trichuris muris TaxID=70415 RepID=A0A5S6QDV8_TRIMR